MKTHHSLCNLFTVVNLAVASAWLAPGTRAADKSVGAVATAPAATTIDKESYDLNVVDGHFITPSGKKLEATVGNMVDCLRERFPDANIIMSPGLAKVKLNVPDLKLRHCDLDSQLKVIGEISGRKFTWYNPISGSGASLYMLQELTALKARVTVEAFGLSAYINWLKEDLAEKKGGGEGAAEKKVNMGKEIDRNIFELKEIIEHTIMTQRGRNNSEMEGWSGITFKFHPGANLLVISAEQQDLEVARKVINALPGQQNESVHTMHSGGAWGGSSGVGARRTEQTEPTLNELEQKSPPSPKKPQTR